MKKSSFILSVGLSLALVFSLFSVEINAQEIPETLLEAYKEEIEVAENQGNCQLSNERFQAGEHLVYKAYYNLGLIWIGVGLVDFKVEETELETLPMYNIRAQVNSLKGYNWIYEVADTYQTYLNQLDLNPHRFLRSVDNDGYTLNYRYDFDRANEKLHIHHMKRRGVMRRENETIDITACTNDILSAFYQVRNIDYTDFEIGDEVPIEVFLDGEIYDAKITYKGKEEVKTRLGKFLCHKVTPTLIEGGMFEDGDDVIVYATADENKIPIIIEAKLSFGKIKVYLKDYEDLTFDLSSKIK